MAKDKQRLRSLPEKYEPGVLLKLDGRTSIFKRLKATYREIVRDLGGEESLSRVQLTLIERYSFLTGLLSEYEAEIARDPRSSKDLVGSYTNTSNAALGLAKSLGLKRKAPSVPAIRAYAGGRGA